MTLTVRSATVTGATTKGSALTHAEMDANWAHVIQASNSTFTPSGTRPSSGSVAAELWDLHFNVKSSTYGAKGDGVTDDTAAIQAAIDAANAVGGGTVFFPLGTYITSSALTVNYDNIVLQGAGDWTTHNNDNGVSTISSTSTGAIIQHGDSTHMTFRGGFAMRNLKLTSSTAAYGLRSYEGTNNIIERCYFKGISAASAVAIQLEARAFQSSTIRDVEIDACANGIFCQSLQNALNIDSCYIHDNTATGIRLGVANTSSVTCVNPRIMNCTIEFNVTNIDIPAARGVIIAGNYFENSSSGDRAIVVGDPNTGANSPICDGVVIRDNFFAGGSAQTYAILLSGNRFEDCTITGNTFSAQVTAAIDNTAIAVASNLRGRFYAPYNRLITTPVLLASSLPDAGAVIATRDDWTLTGPMIVLYDDFVGPVVDTNKWGNKTGTDGSVVAPTITAAVSGACRLTMGANASADMAGNGVQIQSQLNWKTAAVSLAIEARLKIGTSITAVAVYFGFTDQIASLEMPFTLGASDTLTSNATDACGVLFDTGADTDHWWLVGVKNDVDATKQDTGVAPTLNTYETWRVEFTDQGAATFYRNGAIIGSAMSAAVSTGVALTPVVACFSRTSVSRVVDIDYIKVQMRRA